MGADSVNIPLSDIYSAEVNYTSVSNSIFATDTELMIGMRGGRDSFRLLGNGTSNAAVDVLQGTLMR